MGYKKIELIQGDITLQSTDAIVNAANSALAGGGGVDGAIHRVGGRVIYEECARIGFCPVGGAVITSGGNLKARYVIHTVGPIWQNGEFDEPELLKSAYESSLRLCFENNIRSVSFPSISTGVYGYPIKLAAPVAISAAKNAIERNILDRIVFVLFTQDDYNVYNEYLK